MISSYFSPWESHVTLVRVREGGSKRFNENHMEGGESCTELGERERERGRGGGRWKYCCHVSAPPRSGNVQPDVPYILNPVTYDQAEKTDRVAYH